MDDGCLVFIGGQNKESYVQTILNVKALMRLKSRQNPKWWQFANLQFSVALPIFVCICGPNYIYVSVNSAMPSVLLRSCPRWKRQNNFVRSMGLSDVGRVWKEGLFTLSSFDTAQRSFTFGSGTQRSWCWWYSPGYSPFWGLSHLKWIFFLTCQYFKTSTSLWLFKSCCCFLPFNCCYCVDHENSSLRTAQQWKLLAK